MRVMTAGTAAAVIATACLSLAADWPQFLGPERNSTSPEKVTHAVTFFFHDPPQLAGAPPTPTHASSRT